MKFTKDAVEYAAELVEAGVEFAEFAAEWPSLAASEYGRKVETAMGEYWMEMFGDGLPSDDTGKQSDLIAVSSEAVDIVAGTEYADDYDDFATGEYDDDDVVAAKDGYGQVSMGDYRVMHDVTKLEHWQRVYAHDDNHKFNTLWIRDLDKAQEHEKRQEKKRAQWGLEFLKSPRGTFYNSLRPSTRSKVRVAYRKQHEMEWKVDVSPKAQLMGRRMSDIQTLTEALVRCQYREGYKPVDPEQSRLDAWLAGRSRRFAQWRTIRPVEPQRCPVDRPVYVPTDYSVVIDWNKLALSTFRARLSSAMIQRRNVKGLNWNIA